MPEELNNTTLAAERSLLIILFSSSDDGLFIGFFSSIWFIRIYKLVEYVSGINFGLEFKIIFSSFYRFVRPTYWPRGDFSLYAENAGSRQAR